MRVRLIGVLALMTLVIASCGGSVPEAGGPSEGIQVHGDWTIEVYNEDGTLDRHVDFSNDLTANGAQTLAEIATPLYTTASWKLELGKGDPLSAGDSPCGTPGNSQPCEIFPGFELLGDGTLGLLGEFEAEIDGRIAFVASFANRCQVNTTDCELVDFSETFVSDSNGASINVEAGQTVDVEVRFSFTTG